MCSSPPQAQSWFPRRTTLRNSMCLITAMKFLEVQHGDADTPYDGGESRAGLPLLNRQPMSVAVGTPC